MILTNTKKNFIRKMIVEFLQTHQSWKDALDGSTSKSDAATALVQAIKLLDVPRMGDACVERAGQPAELSALVTAFCDGERACLACFVVCSRIVYVYVCACANGSVARS